jgi:hypothetical protein
MYCRVIEFIHRKVAIDKSGLDASDDEIESAVAQHGEMLIHRAFAHRHHDVGCVVEQKLKPAWHQHVAGANPGADRHGAGEAALDRLDLSLRTIEIADEIGGVADQRAPCWCRPQ